MKKLFLLLLSFSFVSCFAVDAEIGVQNLIANELAKKGIITKQDHLGKYNTKANISRAELVGIALKIKGIKLPSNYTCKKYFEDVTKNDWVCSSVEVAADNGLISKENKKFRPNDSATYTEGLSILYKASGLKPTGNEKPDFISNLRFLDWQKKVLYDVYNTNLIAPYRDYSSYNSVYLLRGDTFEFSGILLNALDIKNNAQKVTYSLLRIDGGENLMIKDGKEEITVTEGYINSPIIIGDFMIYQWSSTGGYQKRVYDIQKRKHILYVFGENNISPDGKVLYNCNDVNGYSLFSFETQRVLHRYRGTTSSEIKELGPPPQVCDYSLKNNGTLIYKDGTTYILDEEWKNPLNVLDTYYMHISLWDLKMAYDMRVDNSESSEKFMLRHANAGHFQINNASIKNLGDNVYEFTVEEEKYNSKERKTEIINRYRVKSKVNVADFTIENISSVKQ